MVGHAIVERETGVLSAVTVKKTERANMIAQIAKPALLFLTIHVLAVILLLDAVPALAMKMPLTPTVVSLTVVSKHVESPSRQILAPRNVILLLKPDSLEVALQHALPTIGRLALSQLNTTTVM